MLYDLQHGFRKSRSCESQLLQLIQELAKKTNKNIQTDLIIMDFAKAFDKYHTVAFFINSNIMAYKKTPYSGSKPFCQTGHKQLM